MGFDTIYFGRSDIMFTECFLVKESIFYELQFGEAYTSWLLYAREHARFACLSDCVILIKTSTNLLTWE